MNIAILKSFGRIGKGPSVRRRRSSTKRPAVLERLEVRVALSGLSTNPAAISHAATPAAQTLTAQNAYYNTPSGKTLSVPAPGLLGYVSPKPNGLTASYGGSGPSHGVAQINGNGSFKYTPSIGYSGPDQFTYMARAGTMTSNTATVFITIGSSGGGAGGGGGGLNLLPDTPFYNALRTRRNIDPARFDFYHPRIGALLGLETTGVPNTATTIVSANKDFNVSAARTLHARDPQKFDQARPILGALFELETPASDPSRLVAAIAHNNKQRAIYDRNPTTHPLKNVYLAAIRAIESFENAGGRVQ
jgi:Bacterial Ig domain